MSQNIENQENINNTDDMNIQKELMKDFMI